MVTRRTLFKTAGILGVPVAVGVGVQSLPIRPHLYDVRFDNRRAETVDIDVRLDADDTTVFESTIDVPPDELLHLPCAWPRAAWTYEMAVRVADRDDWQTITWSNAGKLCKKIVITDAGKSFGPVSFYDSSCPTTLDEHSCE
jgi:hypothetical protein